MSKKLIEELAAEPLRAVFVREGDTDRYEQVAVPVAYAPPSLAKDVAAVLAGTSESGVGAGMQRRENGTTVWFAGDSAVIDQILAVYGAEADAETRTITHTPSNSRYWLALPGRWSIRADGEDIRRDIAIRSPRTGKSQRAWKQAAG